jgi:hypothetical protein
VARTADLGTHELIIDLQAQATHPDELVGTALELAAGAITTVRPTTPVTSFGCTERSLAEGAAVTDHEAIDPHPAWKPDGTPASTSRAAVGVASEPGRRPTEETSCRELS